MTTNMSRTEAIALLTATPTACVYFRDRPLVGGEWISVPVRLEDGELVQPHPTDPRGPAIAAPTGVRFYRDVDAESAKYDDLGTRIA